MDRACDLGVLWTAPNHTQITSTIHLLKGKVRMPMALIAQWCTDTWTALESCSSPAVGVHRRTFVCMQLLPRWTKLRPWWCGSAVFQPPACLCYCCTSDQAAVLDRHTCCTAAKNVSTAKSDKGQLQGQWSAPRPCKKKKRWKNKEWVLEEHRNFVGGVRVQKLDEPTGRIFLQQRAGAKIWRLTPNIDWII